MNFHAWLLPTCRDARCSYLLAVPLRQRWSHFNLIVSLLLLYVQRGALVQRARAVTIRNQAKVNAVDRIHIAALATGHLDAAPKGLVAGHREAATFAPYQAAIRCDPDSFNCAV